jgi:hypothetical protein
MCFYITVWGYLYLLWFFICSFKLDGGVLTHTLPKNGLMRQLVRGIVIHTPVHVRGPSCNLLLL